MSQAQEFSTPIIHTYHCLCSQLLLASASTLDERNKRAGESLDNAYIVPLMPADVLYSADYDQEKENGDLLTETASRAGIDSASVSVLINTVLERKPLVVRRSDGFETRYQRRCGRCDLVVGYHLDATQFDAAAKSGRLDKIIYILPGALKLTDDIVEAKTHK